MKVLALILVSLEMLVLVLMLDCYADIWKYSSELGVQRVAKSNEWKDESDEGVMRKSAGRLTNAEVQGAGRVNRSTTNENE